MPDVGRQRQHGFIDVHALGVPLHDASNEAQQCVRNAGQFVKRASFTRSVKEQEPAISGTGTGRRRVTAGAAGLTKLLGIAMKAQT